MANFERLKTVYNSKKYGILPIKSGMLLEIHENVWEGDTKRVLRFKWLVIKVKKPNHPDWTFTIRGEAARMTVEKIYPLSFPNFDKVLLMDDYKIRRSKLYYIRTKVWKDARFKSVIEHGKKGTDLLALIRGDEKSAEIIEPKEEKIEEAKVEETVEAVKEEEKTEVVEEVKEETKIEETEEPKSEETKE